LGACPSPNGDFGEHRQQTKRLFRQGAPIPNGSIGRCKPSPNGVFLGACPSPNGDFGEHRQQTAKTAIELGRAGSVERLMLENGDASAITRWPGSIL
jgi:hypothetical protein